nr:peptidase S10, serine carboxypeptidase, alpha/beta hydrolase fold protein [Tanacetum cinerariifolium]
MTLQVRAFDSAKWRPVLPEYSAVASIVRNASDHLRPFLMMDPPATLEALEGFPPSVQPDSLSGNEGALD